MRTALLLGFVMANLLLNAQNDLTTNIIEGGKTLVELIKVLKPQRQFYTAPQAVEIQDSCKAREQADLCFKNTDTVTVKVYLYKRNGNIYEAVPLTILLPRSSQECLYAIKSGIYKYRMETEREKDGEQVNIIMREGELRLKPCDRITRNIKAE